MDHDEDVDDASYEMDPFDIDAGVDTIQAFASKFTPLSGVKDKVRMPKDKWFGLDHKTKDIWDKYKSIILGYTKSPTPYPFITPSKPPLSS
jgi:hypothetical protein